MGDLAGQLRFFLRSRCGSLKAAFSALDSSAQGKISAQDFDIGLKKLGFTADARSVFTALQEASGSGEITLRTFVSGMMVGDADETTKVFTISPATPRCHSEGHLAPTLLPKPGSMATHPVPVKPGVRASSHGPSVSNTAEARIKHLEEQLVMEQSQRLETELRLTEYLHRAISEEFDVLKRELRQEQAERRAMKVELQDLRSRITGASFTPGPDAMNRLKKLEGQMDRLASPDPDDGKVSTASRSLTLDACSIHSENVLAESGTPSVPRPQSPSTLLRQQNLKLREENLALREQAVEAREIQKAKRDLGSGTRAESPVVDLQRSRAPSPTCQVVQSPPRPDKLQSPPPQMATGKGIARQPPGSFPHQSWKGGLSSARGKGFAHL